MPYSWALPDDLDGRDPHREEHRPVAGDRSFRAVLERLADVTAIVDATATIRYASPYHARGLGWPPDQLLGRSAFDLVHPDDLAATRSAFARLVRQPVGATAVTELRARHRDGSWRELHLCACNALDDAALGAIVVSGWDITDWKQVETPRRLVEALDPVARLAGGIAHRLNNALAPIIAYADLLLVDGRMAAPARGDVEEIQRAAEHAATLARQLLALARRRTLSPVPLALDGMVHRLERALRRVAGDGVELVLPERREPSIVLADERLMEQIVMELASNSRDAMPDGGVLLIGVDQVTLDAAACARRPGLFPGLHVSLSVTDTGSGMDEMTRAHAFEPFYSTKPLERGAGLGLAMVYGGVRQSSGFVEVASAPGRGTTFRIYFPTYAGEEPAGG